MIEESNFLTLTHVDQHAKTFESEGGRGGDMRGAKGRVHNIGVPLRNALHDCNDWITYSSAYWMIINPIAPNKNEGPKGVFLTWVI